jgi:hypothetical protein
MAAIINILFVLFMLAIHMQFKVYVSLVYSYPMVFWNLST